MTVNKAGQRLAAILCAAYLAVAASPGDAATVIGKVMRSRGACTGVSEGRLRVIDAEAAIHLAERIATGADARLEILFDDGTRLALGEHATVVVDAFVYQPAAAAGRLRVNTVGAFRFVSSALANDRDIAVRTPVATITVRGTDFWGGPIDGAFGVFLSDGSVTVANAAGVAVLDAPGQGVTIEAVDSPPGPVTEWPEEKIDRAISTVSFN